MSMETDRVVQYILNCREEARDATKGRRDAWKELWTLFQNRQDTSKKKDWQARCFIPKLSMTIIQAAAMVKRAVISTRKLFKLTPKDRNDKEAIGALREAEDALKREIEESNFADVYGEMMVEAFLLGLGLPKVIWKNGGLNYSNVDILKAYIHPAYEPHHAEPPKYILEEAMMDYAEVRRMAQKINKESRRQIFKMREINQIESDFENSEEATDERLRRGLSDHTKIDRKIGLIYYWGDIVSEDNKTVKKNQLIFLANDKHIVRWQDNPFIHGKPPYVPTVPLVYPHRGVAGIGLAEPIVSLQYTYNNVTNMIVDNLNFTVNKIFEVQPTNLLNQKNITEVYPGKIINKHTSTPAMEEVRTSSLGVDAFNTLELLNQEIQKGTAVTEFLMGWAGKHKTATEAELKTNQAQGLFDVIARDIEANSLQPLIEMSFDLMCQFGDLPIELMGRYDFKVGGLSLLLVQREQKQNISEALGAAIKVPQLYQMTNVPDLYKRHLDVLGLQDVFVDPRDNKGKPPTDEQAMETQQRAAEDAKNAVANMSPEEQEQAVAQLEGT